ncbi:MAG: CCA tRNA nucleotidyltransferase [Kiritimatiellae bacterium]|nr:CCA tRNA nucleotidyltransferase [Kiritimatiellia bacterium]
MNPPVPSPTSVVDLPPIASYAPRAVARLRAAGHDAWLVGGCVRDLLLGKTPKDYDVVTSAHPRQIEALFPHNIPVGKAFGIITIVAPGTGENVEIATYRAEADYRDGRHPSSVAYADSAREDVLRRDFTVNALLLDPATGQLADFVGGRADLTAKTLRAIGDPARRFAEDRLRMLRATRFASVLGFTIESATWDALRAAAPAIHEISPERIRDELFRTLLGTPRAGAALDLLHDSGLLAQILPEVEAMRGVEQPPEYHPEGDVYVHTRIMLDRLPPPGPDRPLSLALGVLLHDVGKPPTAAFLPRPSGGPPRWTFQTHAAVGADMARAILQRLRAPTALIDDVVALVATHMRLAEAPKMRRAKLRRLLADPLLPQHLELHRLDCLSSHGDLDIYDFLRAQRAAWQAEPVLPPPLVTGRDLIALGYTPGPAFGLLLARLHDLQLEEDITDKALLLARLSSLET